MSASLTPATDEEQCNGQAGAILARVAVDEDCARLSVGHGTDDGRDAGPVDLEVHLVQLFEARGTVPQRADLGLLRFAQLGDE